MKDKLKPACLHWWRIESPTSGRTSQGVCRKCGAEKTFCNDIEAVKEAQKRKLKAVKVRE